MTWPFGALHPHHYGAILIDPPWAFETYAGEHVTPHRTAMDHYRTMDMEALAALPVGALAARDCALFLWAVDSHLEMSFPLMRHWGFAFKTRGFTWNKGAIGHGYWTRKQTEICLIATRGAPRRRGKGVREVIDAPRREHSRKPDETHARIETLVDGPYCEIFARTKRRGWDCWGDQLGMFQEG